MKTISTLFRDQSLAVDAATLCTCWEIERRDGVIFRFTDLDIDLTVAGNLYKAAIGYNRTAVSNSGDLSVDNMDVEGLLDDDTITVEDMRAGLFNGAKIRVFVVDWTAPENGIMRVRRGWLGEVLITPNGKFHTELRGMNQALSQKVGDVLSPECRADLGDGKCKVDIEDPVWARTGTVSTVSDRRTFTVVFDDPDSRASDANWYRGGVLTWLTGNNAGRNIEVKTWDGANELSLFLSMPYNVQVGDTFKLRPGCDKRAVTCRTKFNNIVNMRAEPFIPGADLLATYPDAK